VINRGGCVVVVATAGVNTKMTRGAGPVRVGLAERRVMAVGACGIVHSCKSLNVGVARAIGPCCEVAVATSAIRGWIAGRVMDNRCRRGQRCGGVIRLVAWDAAGAAYKGIAVGMAAVAGRDHRAV